MLFCSKITSGDTFRLPVALPNYSSLEWALMVAIRGNTSINIAAQIDGDNFLFLVTPDITSTWVAGQYNYQLYVSKTGARETVESGKLEILPDLVTIGTGYDPRSYAQKMLDAINATLENRATTDQQQLTYSTQAGQRSIAKTPLLELMQLKSYFENELRKEQGRGGLRLIKAII